MYNVCAEPADDVKASFQEDLTSNNAERVLSVKYELEITLGETYGFHVVSRRSED